MIVLAPNKITKRHREREAYVYVRQSTLKQVQQHQESRHNQYALVQRAIELGWLPERIHLIDCDLGQSGQDSQRPGFQSLVTAVSLGKVGLILAVLCQPPGSQQHRLVHLAGSVTSCKAESQGNAT